MKQFDRMLIHFVRHLAYKGLNNFVTNFSPDLFYAMPNKG